MSAFVVRRHVAYVLICILLLFPCFCLYAWPVTMHIVMFDAIVEVYVGYLHLADETYLNTIETAYRLNIKMGMKRERKVHTVGCGELQCDAAKAMSWAHKQLLLLSRQQIKGSSASCSWSSDLVHRSFLFCVHILKWTSHFTWLYGCSFFVLYFLFFTTVKLKNFKSPEDLNKYTAYAFGESLPHLYKRRKRFIAHAFTNDLWCRWNGKDEKPQLL